jgi:hypothetical protein
MVVVRRKDEEAKKDGREGFICQCPVVVRAHSIALQVGQKQAEGKSDCELAIQR